ncbi:MAG: hypothetical protein WBC97_10015 [Gemmatimonadales bacterium]
MPRSLAWEHPFPGPPMPDLIALLMLCLLVGATAGLLWVCQRLEETP